MITIKKATKKDIDIVRKLEYAHARWWDKHEPKWHDSTSKRAIRSYQRYIRQVFVSKHYSVWLAEEGLEVVGYCIVKIDKGVPAMTYKKYGYIGDLYVKKNWRKKGIGIKLLKAGMAWLKKKGMKALVIDTSTINVPAKKLYKKLGFKEFHVYSRKFL